MSLFDFADHFQIVEGELPIVVGAPHHGTRPNVDADRGTGPIALALAQRLNARAVIVSDLRRTADVNKDPTRLAFTVRAHALRYQNEMFRAMPPLVIEVHGHVSGQYAIELTTGFDLDPTAPSDMRFLQKLMQLKQTLPRLLSGKIGQSPTLGIYPLDRDVLKTATDTFTFQKIRRARNLTGAEWYGLHIELSAALRTSQQAQSAAFIAALADAFATAVQSVFDPLPAPDATIPAHVDQPDGVTALLAPRSLRVTRAPTQYVNANVVVVHPIDLETLGALDGDAVVLRHGYEELRSTITPSLTIRPNPLPCPRACVDRLVWASTARWSLDGQRHKRRPTARTITNCSSLPSCAKNAGAWCGLRRSRYSAYRYRSIGPLLCKRPSNRNRSIPLS
jgi:hypothetical protein